MEKRQNNEKINKNEIYDYITLYHPSTHIPQPSKHKVSAGSQIQRAQVTWETIIIIANATTATERNLLLLLLPRLRIFSFRLQIVK